MRKRMVVVALSILATLSLTGCVKGERLNDEIRTKNQMLLNSGSMFAYTFQDEETGVWYIATNGGVAPRVSLDGSLYISDE